MSVAVVVVIAISARAVRAMAFANHSLQSYFFQKEFFRHLNMDFTIFFNVIVTDISKLSLSFKTKT